MPRGDWSSRLAGGVLSVVGLANLAVGVLALVTGLVRVSVGVAGGFLAVGLAMLAVGILVWRGNRAATIVAFAVFLGLLVLQIGQVVAAPDVDPAVAAATGEEQVVGRVVVLALLAITSGIAAWRRRRVAR